MIKLLSALVAAVFAIASVSPAFASDAKQETKTEKKDTKKKAKKDDKKDEVKK